MRAHLHMSCIFIVSRDDIQSVWCGNRPLVAQTREGKETAGVVRSHAVLVDEKSGLVSLIGGKWTTYRRMAEVQNAVGRRQKEGDHIIGDTCMPYAYRQRETH